MNLSLQRYTSRRLWANSRANAGLLFPFPAAALPSAPGSRGGDPAPSNCPTCGTERHWRRSGIRNGKPYVKATCPACEQKRTARRRERVGGAAALNKRWEAANPQKKSAHRLVESAIRDGRLAKQPCERCGSLNVHAHHDDYSKPLEVMWLCPIHHKERHRELDAAASEQEVV